ncbi:hypothetical protein HAX54_015544, partial [Datura stramonium]|nr:hypothetical protein [Datura stramonium]
RIEEGYWGANYGSKYLKIEFDPRDHAIPWEHSLLPLSMFCQINECAEGLDTTKCIRLFRNVLGSKNLVVELEDRVLHDFPMFLAELNHGVELLIRVPNLRNCDHACVSKQRYSS